ncbi:endonuclease/exonuclease/phosphatase family protein [Nocardia sp. NPDC023852]|uniref:endonuclease/exonuclease/phosphatase family protein n=1 Tax=Nocardia sp. NPDC023852 TaxID=3154697 RepID=UPI00340E68B3
MVITVATWNVLHRVHAENWYEDVATRWPDEGARIAAITARVAERTEQVIALQEVSGDQLAGLRLALPGRTFHALRYQRLPTPRRVPSSLLDGGEYLVVLTEEPSRELAAESFAQDPGKGALVVDAAGLVVIATHVTGDRRRATQLARLTELASTTIEHATVLLGDFNTDRGSVAAGLGDGFAVAESVPGGLPTRPRESGAKSQHIDHVAVRGAHITDLTVDDMGGVSDHNLVHAAVTM